jgi:hypothetical protein
MAVCIVLDGLARQQCLDPVKTVSSTALVNWSISQITGRSRASESLITDQEIAFLTKGRHRVLNANITFSLPASIKVALQEIIENRNRGRDRGLDRELTQ